ncbi:MAG: ABC transporter permease subunit, partial [Deltaproteobacteria bacterium]|nr:ABC transporter permease subunit [Deltaproteobacteria bacterium]
MKLWLNDVGLAAFVVVVILTIWYATGRIDYIWRWGSVPQYLAYRAENGGFLGWAAGPLLKGVLMTLKISVVSVIAATIIGLFTGLARISSQPAPRWLAIGYIELIRGTPLLVQIFIFYFFIGTVLNLSRFSAGTAALSVFAGAYVAEIVRSG